jgi:RimJ/RimL family protein N-acetyltransferase
MIIIETERLILQEFITDDALFILKLVNCPTWLQFIGDRNVKTKEEAANYILNWAMHSYKKHGFGSYLVRLKIMEEPIGACGLFKREGLQDIDLGFALLPQYTGFGYALEAASAVLAYAKETLKLNRIVAITTGNNTNSINLLQKLNMHFEKLIKLPNEEKEFMLFATK